MTPYIWTVAGWHATKTVWYKWQATIILIASTHGVACPATVMTLALAGEPGGCIQCINKVVQALTRMIGSIISSIAYFEAQKAGPLCKHASRYWYCNLCIAVLSHVTITMHKICTRVATVAI
jgi:hypothetical protein